ncbi:pilus assembly FimT family protein [Propionispira raffinosivorans]|uniref:pilus assembly FimT family protein n=1 Tax=Propionispira raffinosivorans TaxID=86959 RepID=UPI0003797265|nr:hypothetical protein [Propionispira raffinosivorans]
MDEQGTSYIELLCVLLIVNILAAIILPKLTMMDKISLDYEARYLVSDLRWMQEQSIYRMNGNEKFNRIEFDTMPKLVMDQNPESGYVIFKGPNIVKQHTFTKPITIPTNYVNVRFTIDGRMNPPRTIYLYEGHERLAVIIDVAGRIRIEKPGSFFK